ncbi:hypothetical protein [Bacillus cihuensis]|uniref:hypothetical protein n=1 Tax=Bacillus cihuensis TaxID=1208599 RepID=UPI0003FAAB87|nr:hypothetical protein [Bacillus cihuensis]
MRSLGKTIKLSRDGKLKLSKKILKNMNVTPGDLIEISVTNKNIHLQTVKPTCMITGKQAENMIQLTNGDFISKEGIEILKRELEKMGWL